MASDPPPLQVEDNTDEDFFDKLVNDDDDDMNFNVPATQLASVGLAFTDGNESDDARAFANLSFNDPVNSGEVENDAASSSNYNEFDNLIAKNGFQVGTVEGGANPLVSLNSFEFDTSTQLHEDESGNAIGLPKVEVVSKSSSGGFSDATVVSHSDLGSGTPGVRKVDWSVFHADSAQNASNGFGSYSDFFSELEGVNAGDAFENVLGDKLNNGSQIVNVNDVHASASVENSSKYEQYNEGYSYGTTADQSASAEVQDLNSSQQWENQYPGWKYDTMTGQWYQVDGYDAGTSTLVNANSDLSSTLGLAEGQAEVSYLQQSASSVAGITSESGTTESVTSWNQAPQPSDASESTTYWNQVSQMTDKIDVQSDWNQSSQDDSGYPSHMVFDPQYPGWYYDTISGEWRTLESYTASCGSIAHIQGQMNQNGFTSTNTYSQNSVQKDNSQVSYSTYGLDSNSRGQDQIWAGSKSNHNQQSPVMWRPDSVAIAEPSSHYSGSQLMESHYVQKFSPSDHGSQQDSVHYGAAGSHYYNSSQAQNNFSMPSQSQGLHDGGNFNDARTSQNEQRNASHEYYKNYNAVNFSQPEIHNAQIAYAPAPGRSSAGCPAHALVAFGFGGKLVMMKYNSSSENLSYGNQNLGGGSLSVLNLAEVVTNNIDASNSGMGVCNYFQALGQQSVPGPLTGGSVSTKDLNKWIDDRIANPESGDMDYRKAEVLRLLLSLLKICFQYYGKLRSPYGADAVFKDSDAPESAVARLFASAENNGSQFSQYGAAGQCLQQMPSEGQMRITVAQVQSFLVSGRKKEALECAQEGQLWGPALVLAAQLGDQFYAETVKQMALRQLAAGSPLRTLCLLIAGQPADVFSADTTSVASMAGAVNFPQQPSQSGANGMLDDWKENLAVITANRTKDDELVLLHLGDCLWKDRSDICAAHICYLVAEASFESYSDGARMCLVGADHWKFPRTYASPEAIQRTEIYEYSKTLANSQFVLEPFQPYKLLYAHMLAEVGRISDALKYSQAVLKSLKMGRTPEVETLRHLASSLEERIKAHQQGGFSTNLAPKKLVGKLLNLFDSTAHRVVGGLPPPVPTAGVTVQGNDNYYQSAGHRVSASQSTMTMSSLVPQSMEPLNEGATSIDRLVKHSRSVSEPDFGRSPRQAEASSTGKASAIGITSRFGRFGFGTQLLQKTVGLVLKPRQGRQAKLGDSNKFYYDEKLKRWVEEGAATPAEEPTLAPPPTTAVFQNGTSDYNFKSALQSQAFHSNGSPEFKSASPPDSNSGIPPLPPTSNQYSARGRMNVRSRYVDTFNQSSGNATNLFQSPSAPVNKPAPGSNPKFFVPTPVSSSPTSEQSPEPSSHSNTMQGDPAQLSTMQGDISSSTYENSSFSPPNNSFQSTAPPSSISMQRFKSMNNISVNATPGDNGSFSVQSRRTASWSGNLNNSFSPPHVREVKPLGKVMGINPSSFMPTGPGLGHSGMSGVSFGDDLQEVEL